MKQKTTFSLLAVLTALVLLGGIAFTVVKAQAPNPETPATEENLPAPLSQSRFDLRNEHREARQAQRQQNNALCDCSELTVEECDALRYEHRLERLNDALAEGKITQEQYDAALAKLEAGEWPPFEPGQGLGLGNGFGKGNGQGLRQGNGQGQRQGLGQGQGFGQDQGFGQGQGGKHRQNGGGNQGNCPNLP